MTLIGTVLLGLALPALADPPPTPPSAPNRPMTARHCYCLQAMPNNGIQPYRIVKYEIQGCQNVAMPRVPNPWNVILNCSMLAQCYKRGKQYENEMMQLASRMSREQDERRLEALNLQMGTLTRKMTALDKQCYRDPIR